MSGDTIFILTHEYELDGYDTMKILGVYSEQSIAEKARAHFAQQPGFRDHPDGFVIDESEVDRNMWSEGFVTVRVPLPNSDNDT